MTHYRVTSIDDEVRGIEECSCGARFGFAEHVRGVFLRHHIKAS